MEQADEAEIVRGRGALEQAPSPNEFKELLARLAASSGAAVAVGQAALALAGQRPWPASGPLDIVLADDGAGGRSEAPERVRLHRVVPEPSFAEALLTWLRRQPVRAWALAVAPDGQVLDPAGAVADASERRLRLQVDPRAFVHEGAHRLLDLAVWAAQSGLRPAGDLVRLCQRDAGNVLALDRAVWCDRVGAVLVADHAATGLRFLHESSMLQLMAPEAVAMVDFHKSCPVHHKDICDHTLQVVEKCPPVLVVRWAALMHDTGKVWTRTVHKGKVHFFRHEDLGASLMEGVGARFHMDPALVARVAYVIANHARANVYASDWSDSAVRRLIRDLGPHLDDVLAFSQSDFTTKRSQRIAQVRSLADELNARIPQIVAEDTKVPALPKGFGTFVLAQTGLVAGPWLGRIQQWLEAEADAGRIERQREPAYYLDHVQRTQPDLLAVAPGTERQRIRPKA